MNSRTLKHLFAQASLVVAIAILLIGCASYKVVYDSFPPGATLFQNGEEIGKCPITLTYKYTGEDRQKGYLSVPTITAKWPDGRTRDLVNYRLRVAALSEELLGPTLPAIHYWNFHAELPTNTPPTGSVNAVTPAQSARETDNGLVGRLKLIDDLRNQGLLTDEEHKQKRREALDSL